MADQAEVKRRTLATIRVTAKEVGVMRPESAITDDALIVLALSVLADRLFRLKEECKDIPCTLCRRLNDET